jgi:hypothetical protein
MIFSVPLYQYYVEHCPIFRYIWCIAHNILSSGSAPVFWQLVVITLIDFIFSFILRLAAALY